MPRSTQATPTAPAAPTPEQPQALVAAAMSVSARLDRRKYKAAQTWQEQAWGYYDTRGPLRYAVSWFSNALARATLHVARRTDDGLEPVTSGPGYDMLQEVLGGSDGQSAFLKSMGQHYFVAGEWYLVGRGARIEDETITSADEVWEIVSSAEMKNAGGNWSIDYGDGDVIPLTDDDVIVRMWNPHPKRRTVADSPVRGALGDLYEIEVLSKHIGSQVFSRLTGAGILAVPSEMSFAAPKSSSDTTNIEADPLLLNLAETMTTAIEDPGSVEALVPIILKVAGEYVDKIRHITFWSDLDEKAIEMREAALRNLSISLDLPPEVLTGTADMNHWGAWQVDESAIKAHIEPALEVIASSLTVAILRKVEDDPDLVIAYDTSKLRMRPNRSKEALELFDRGEINGKALRRETGFAEADAHDDETFKRWLLKKVGTGSATPGMVLSALRSLGVEIEDIGAEQPNNQSRPDPSLVDHPDNSPPEMPDQQAASLMATCSVLAYRALERAGNRLKNKAGVRPDGVFAADLHTYVKVEPAACDALLTGAWEPLPTLLRGVTDDVARVETALDSYCRSVLIAGKVHDPDLMQRFINAALVKAAA